MVLQLDNSKKSWDNIASRPVLSNKRESKFSSLKGRRICLIHTLSTPIKIYVSVSRLALTLFQTAFLGFGIVSLNIHPKNVSVIVSNLIDIPLATFLLPLEVCVNVIRGLAGLLHPGAMIRETSNHSDQIYCQHNILIGTLINYPLQQENIY
jgi:hypothetical protein